MKRRLLLYATLPFLLLAGRILILMHGWGLEPLPRPSGTLVKPLLQGIESGVRRVPYDLMFEKGVRRPRASDRGLAGRPPPGLYPAEGRIAGCLVSGRIPGLVRALDAAPGAGCARRDPRPRADGSAGRDEVGVRMHRGFETPVGHVERSHQWLTSRLRVEVRLGVRKI